MKIFDTIRDFGVIADMSAEDKKYTRLTNILNLATIFILGIPALIVIQYSSFPYKGQGFLIRFELLILFSLLNLYLNKRRFYTLTKLLTVFAPFVLIFILPIILHFIHSGMLLWMPYGIMILGTYSFCLFSLKKERRLLIGISIFFTIASMFYDNFFVLSSKEIHLLDKAFINEYYIPYQLTLCVFPVLLYINLYLLKHRDLILQTELDQKNELLSKLNENLEEQVMERTSRIQEVAHTNSHLLRASTCRILGLSNLLEITDDKTEVDYCLKAIVSSVKEMDVVTKELSYKLAGEKINTDVLSK